MGERGKKRKQKSMSIPWEVYEEFEKEFEANKEEYARIGINSAAQFIKVSAQAGRETVRGLLEYVDALETVQREKVKSLLSKIGIQSKDQRRSSQEPEN